MKGSCLKSSLLIILMLAGINFYGQQDPDATGTPNISKKPTFRKLWRSQAYLNLGVLGYRSVSETDMFTVRQFNPNGSDLITFEEMEVVNRQSYYPLLTTGGAIHRNIQLLINDHVTLHAEIAGMLFLQRIFAPSVAENLVKDSAYYPVKHYNMPSITNLSLSGGLWLNEMFGLGVRVSRSVYGISTNDDRKEQKELNVISVEVNPYISFWLPLDGTAMNRWCTRFTIDGTIPGGKNKGFSVPSAELAFFRLSKERSGRALGIFARYLRSPEIKYPEKYPFYNISHDAQFILGVSIGTGGLNRRSGR